LRSNVRKNVLAEVVGGVGDLLHGRRGEAALLEQPHRRGRELAARAQAPAIARGVGGTRGHVLQT